MSLSKQQPASEDFISQKVGHSEKNFPLNKLVDKRYKEKPLPGESTEMISSTRNQFVRY